MIYYTIFLQAGGGENVKMFINNEILLTTEEKGEGAIPPNPKGIGFPRAKYYEISRSLVAKEM